MRLPKKTILHLHIPRTGGSSVSDVLRRYTSSGEARNHNHTLTSIRDFERASPLKTAVVTGHYRFGCHVAFKRYVYFIVLREPVARVWSMIRFIKAKPDHPKHRWIAAMGDDLDAIFDEQHRAAGGAQFRDGMVWQLDPDAPAGKVTATALLNASSLLDSEDVVFATPETLADGIARLGNKVGFTFPEVPRINAAPAERIAPSLRRRIEACNSFDLSLYDKAMRKIGTLLGLLPLPLIVPFADLSTEAEPVALGIDFSFDQVSAFSTVFGTLLGAF